MALREAWVIAANRGLSKIVVEGDSLQVQALTQAGKSFADCGSILSVCLVLLLSFFSCTFVHVKRSCNKEAHSLAKRSLLGTRL